MAGVSPWLLGTLALAPALGLALWFSAHGPVAQRLVASQMAGGVTTFLLAMSTFSLTEASSVDLALTVALLNLPATLLFALFVERWL